METDREILRDGETLALRMGLPALALRLRAAADRQQAALDRLARESTETRAEACDAYREGWDDCARYCESPPHTTDWDSSAAKAFLRDADNKSC